jgi:hypothetical protein
MGTGDTTTETGETTPILATALSHRNRPSDVSFRVKEIPDKTGNLTFLVRPVSVSQLIIVMDLKKNSFSRNRDRRHNGGT